MESRTQKNQRKVCTKRNAKGQSNHKKKRTLSYERKIIFEQAFPSLNSKHELRLRGQRESLPHH